MNSAVFFTSSTFDFIQLRSILSSFHSTMLALKHYLTNSNDCQATYQEVTTFNAYFTMVLNL